MFHILLHFIFISEHSTFLFQNISRNINFHSCASASKLLIVSLQASIWSEMCRDFRLLAACGSPRRSLTSPCGLKGSENVALTSDPGGQALSIVAGGTTCDKSQSFGHVPSCTASCSLASTYLADSRGQIQHTDRMHYSVTYPCLSS